MRICLVTHGFPPHERTGVEQYTALLAAELSRRGHVVEVFAPRRVPEYPDYSLRREVREVGGGVSHGVNWVTLNRNPEGPLEMLEVPAVARVFGRFLDRERPEVCHFQHVVKLGIGLIDEARRRDIPTLYTAHDYYAVCHRYTLLRPDLTPCDVRGDSMACARCDLALGHLNAQPGLGDYQMGVFKEQLTEPAWERLKAILDDDTEAAGIDLGEVDAAFDLRQDLDARRARAFDALDRILAPTEFLRSELERGGVDPRKLEVLRYGIETGDLADVPPVRVKGPEPLRLAFIGGLSKHKGVHRLLQAWRLLAESPVEGARPAELSIWGYSTDAVYHEALRKEAAGLGVHWRGPYERAELPAVMATADVVICPSTWVENYPIVIREAFAAGRPVVASDFGALPESVRDGVDGLLFGRDDADDLARVLRRLVAEPELVGELVAGLPEVHGVAAQAEELLERYASLVGAREDEDGPDLPPSLRVFQSRYEEISERPTRELLRGALAKLAVLREGLGVGGVDVTELFGEVGEGLRTQDWMRDARQEIEWLRGKLQQEGDIRDELEEAVAYLRRELYDSREGDVRKTQHLRAAEEYVREKEGVLSTVEERLRETESYVRAKEQDLEAAEAQLGEVADYVATKEAEVRAAHEELEKLREYAREKERVIADFEGALREAGAYARTKEVELVQTEDKLGEAGRHIEEQREALEAMRAELEAASEHVRKQESDLAAKARGLDEAATRMREQERSIGLGQGELDRAREDLRDVRDELEEAREECSRAEAAREVAEAALREKEGEVEAVRSELDELSTELEEKAGELEAHESAIEERDALLRASRKELEATAARAAAREEEESDKLRSAAELGMVAIDTQRRLLSQELLPLFEGLSQAVAPQAEPEGPHPEASFGHLLEALRDLQEKAHHVREELGWRRTQAQELERLQGEVARLREELDWRRGEMEKLADVMRRVAGVRSFALERYRKRVLGWESQAAGDPDNHEEERT